MNKPANVQVSESFRARFTTGEFAQVFAAAVPLDIRLELVDGYLERMTPPMGAHSTRQTAVSGMLWSVLQERAMVEAAIDLGDDTVLVCDVAILYRPMSEQRFLRADEVIVAVEIAETTLDRDLGLKRTAYARAGIPHYWVVDGPHGQVHVFELQPHGDYGPATLIPFGRALPIPGTDRTIVIG